MKEEDYENNRRRNIVIDGKGEKRNWKIVLACCFNMPPRRVQIQVFGKILIVLSLVFLLGQLSLIMFCSCKCGNRFGNDKDYSIMVDRGARSLVDEERVTKSENMANILKLSSKIEELERTIRKYQQLDKYIIQEEFRPKRRHPLLSDGGSSSSFLASYTPRNEHEVIPFTSITARHAYGEIGFLSKRPQATPVGQQAGELREVLKYALADLNRDVEAGSDQRISMDNFLNGVTRNDFTQGTVYDLYFRSNNNNVFKRLKLLRPFETIQKIGKAETIDTTNEIINIIIPLSGRIEKFRSFMDRLVDVGIRRDKRIFVTLVYFGKEGRQEIKDYFLKLEKEEHFEDYKVIFTSQDFNRGAGLQKGVQSWHKGNVLMFFCDIDIFFEEDFLERCRLHTSPGSRIYYPIVFSQYNPDIVYGGRPPPLDLRERMRILPESGFWRDFGFGMTCQYKDDFLRVGGFDLSIKGWGGEDLALYKQYLNDRSLTIVRAYDPALVHIYHGKNCRKTLSDSQFISCLQSKAMAEGSHKQLGMLAFGTSLVNGEDPDWANRLKISLNQIVSQVKVDGVEEKKKKV